MTSPFKNTDLEPISINVDVTYKVSKITPITTVQYSESHFSDSEEVVREFTSCNCTHEYKHQHYTLSDLMGELENLINDRLSIIGKKNKALRNKLLRMKEDCKGWKVVHCDVKLS